MAKPTLLLTFSIIAIVIIITTLAPSPQPHGADEPNQLPAEEASGAGDGKPDSGRLPVPAIRRFLAKSKELTCDKEPSICGSSTKGGPDHCCEKKCVDLKTDGLNCGKCGSKCEVNEACCNGKCVNLATDRKNCGSCGNKCRQGSNCSYGMCGYAR
ncbi:STIG1 protein [Nymphaea thermarum]|nr:STIG1 protein [Nymphaea thermarum]